MSPVMLCTRLQRIVDRKLILKIPRLASLFTFGALAVQTGSYLVEDDSGAGRGALEVFFTYLIWLVRSKNK